MKRRTMLACLSAVARAGSFKIGGNLHHTRAGIAVERISQNFLFRNLMGEAADPRLTPTEAELFTQRFTSLFNYTDVTRIIGRSIVTAFIPAAPTTRAARLVLTASAAR